MYGREDFSFGTPLHLHLRYVIAVNPCSAPTLIDLSQYGQSGFSWQIQAYGGLKLLKEKQAIIWQAAIVV